MKSLRDFVRLPAAGIQFGLMASYHCTVKAGASASAGAHAAYIEREGRYKSRSGRDLEAVESGNLPDWAERSADFWKASDENERANAKAYREYEVALPREMTTEQRLELVREFVRIELGERHAYTFAIHNPRAALEGGEQPHAHIMFSERVIDGIKRDTPQHYFKQSSSKDPARGGCKKVNSARKTSQERKADLIALRERWADLQNKFLEKHGHADRVDHRTLEDRGIDRVPADHLGPKAAAMEQRGLSTSRGQARTQRLADIAEMATIPALVQRIQADRHELAAIDAPRPNPNHTPVDLKSKAAQVAASWSRLVQAERDRLLQEMVIDTQKAAKALTGQYQAHMGAQPKLLGRREWEVKRVAMEEHGHQLNLVYSDLQAGRYPTLAKDRESVQQEALRRAAVKEPELAAEVIRATKAQREQAVTAKTRADGQVKANLAVEPRPHPPRSDKGPER